jgi:hypothetical protein
MTSAAGPRLTALIGCEHGITVPVEYIELKGVHFTSLNN